MPRFHPNLLLEMRALAEGHRYIAGVDEAGRGPLAGPVVAAAVILPLGRGAGWLHLPRDSKQLTAQQREEVFAVITSEALSYGVGAASAAQIDALGIVPATRLAMMTAIAELRLQPNFVLVDAVRLPDLKAPHDAVIKGDDLSVSIAAASIVAKVVRDRQMVELDRLYPGYGFARHKGYPTEAHLKAMAELGPCPEHRRSFRPVAEVMGDEEMERGEP
ncbi:MAG: ribonuclease HII [Chloroflexota bacterium]|nr:MAG: ribonuclease HII [Chloroflexota bacterium]